MKNNIIAIMLSLVFSTSVFAAATTTTVEKTVEKNKTEKVVDQQENKDNKEETK